MSYKADNRITINNVTELNLITEALQTMAASYMRAHGKASEVSPVAGRTLHLKALATGKLLDRLRVGWKAADGIPEEIQAQLAAREDTRFWSDIKVKIEEMSLEQAAGLEDDGTCLNLYPIPA